MKKSAFLWSLLAIIMAATVSVGLSSCGDDDEDDFVSVAMPQVTMDKNGGTQVVPVTSNTKWTAMSSASWLTVAPVQGSGNGSVMLTAQANTTGQSRSTVVSITAGNASAMIMVSQDGNGSGGDGQDLASIVAGTYVGRLISGGEVVNDAYKVVINRLNSTAVEIAASFFGDAPVNFNVTENSTGQYNLTNINYSNITMYVSGKTLYISFVNGVQTMTSFVGTKD